MSPGSTVPFYGSSNIDFGPLAHVNTAETRLPAFGGELQPGLWRPAKERKFANSAPLGLFGFALNTFVMGCLQMRAMGITDPHMIVGLAYSYGGFVQLLAGMWEMASGNTFGATALSSYGGFWIALGINFTPGGFNTQAILEQADSGKSDMFFNSMGLFVFGWFIFTFLMLLCTLKSTVFFFLLFFFVDVSFLLLGVSYVHRGSYPEYHIPVMKASGLFALLASFTAWYIALAGVMDDSNSFFIIPVFHFPWSEKGRQSRKERRESQESQKAQKSRQPSESA
ncbi:hypothetical protein ASPWEDRAFT_51871 [Aspergillus wentii DTO 134E9]|uniref:Acetate permease A n=1 Tax=Aspergillus wentii DTO 134E9 TaxID=1073089 RepID=A0A1L9RM02_ASPWE|nr:uncharacterized protein ASPWEDRAFT_51871 [Aspergillus wentii DTO 134E9]OJJ35969.1 hypothetical protein ASPWEDRAFT_51871 [Aspergillus wentii DTO 134E9]